MNQLTQNFNGHTIRIINQDNGEIWFVAKDVCDALEITNSRNAYARLDDEEKLTSVLWTGGQNREMTIVSESGLYKIIFQSNKPNAKTFTNWVTKEVLPSIRKTGGYNTTNSAEGEEVARVVRYDNALYEQVMIDVMALPSQEARVRMMRNVKALMFGCVPVNY